MTLWEITRPMHIITMIYLISPYYAYKQADGKRKYQFSKVSFVINTLGLLFFLGSEIGTLIFTLLELREYTTERLIPGPLIIVILYYTTTLGSANLLSRRAIDFLNDLMTIDEKFLDISICPNDTVTRRIINCLTFLEVASIVSIFVYCSFKQGISISLATFIYRNALSHVRMTVLSQFTCYTFLLYYRFKLLNDQLVTYKALYDEASPVLRKHISCSIRVCCSLHERLTQSSYLLNKAFDIQMTATFISLFWFVVIVLNILLRDNNIMAALNYSMLNSIKITLLLIGVFLVALVCTKTQQKVIKDLHNIYNTYLKIISKDL